MDETWFADYTSKRRSDLSQDAAECAADALMVEQVLRIYLEVYTIKAQVRRVAPIVYVMPCWLTFLAAFASPPDLRPSPLESSRT
jgi:hypothetical protein